jgi:hypothetical protein
MGAACLPHGGSNRLLVAMTVDRQLTTTTKRLEYYSSQFSMLITTGTRLRPPAPEM